MKTPFEVADDYESRRTGILRALVDDVDEFFAKCDPDKENLCLYGNPDGSWEGETRVLTCENLHWAR